MRDKAVGCAPVRVQRHDVGALQNAAGHLLHGGGVAGGKAVVVRAGLHPDAGGAHFLLRDQVVLLPLLGFGKPAHHVDPAVFHGGQGLAQAAEFHKPDIPARVPGQGIVVFHIVPGVGAVGFLVHKIAVVKVADPHRCGGAGLRPGRRRPPNQRQRPRQRPQKNRQAAQRSVPAARGLLLRTHDACLPSDLTKELLAVLPHFAQNQVNLLLSYTLGGHLSAEIPGDVAFFAENSAAKKPRRSLFAPALAPRPANRYNKTNAKFVRRF